MAPNNRNKVTTSVYLDASVKERIDEMNGVNTSGLVNQILRDYVHNGGQPVNGLELRKERIEAEIEELESELSRKREELETVTEEIEKRENNEDPTVEDAIETVAGMIEGHDGEDFVYRGWDNPALDAQANKANMSKRALVEEAKERAGVEE